MYHSCTTTLYTFVYICSKQTIYIMKKILLLAVALATLISCSEEDCGSYNGNELFQGPENGCYYINSNGNQTYVDRSLCDC